MKIELRRLEDIIKTEEVKIKNQQFKNYCDLVKDGGVFISITHKHLSINKDKVYLHNKCVGTYDGITDDKIK